MPLILRKQITHISGGMRLDECIAESLIYRGRAFKCEIPAKSGFGNLPWIRNEKRASRHPD